MEPEAATSGTYGARHVPTGLPAPLGAGPEEVVKPENWASPKPRLPFPFLERKVTPTALGLSCPALAISERFKFRFP